MSIAYELDLDKYNIGSFSELIMAIMEQAMKIGLETGKKYQRYFAPQPLQKCRYKKGISTFYRSRGL